MEGRLYAVRKMKGSPDYEAGINPALKDLLRVNTGQSDDAAAVIEIPDILNALTAHYLLVRDSDLHIKILLARSAAEIAGGGKKREIAHVNDNFTRLSFLRWITLG